jgi:hypothetical protein
MGYKEDLHKVQQKIDDLAKRLPVQGSRSHTIPWYGYPLLLVIIGGICSIAGSFFAARWQLDRTREDTALDQRIDDRINAKLPQINEGIAKLREDVAYLKAKVEDVTEKKIIDLSKLPASKVGDNLSDISKTISKAREREIIFPPEVIIELRKKLALVQPRNANFWMAFSNVVSYQSLLAEKMSIFPNADEVKRHRCPQGIGLSPGSTRVIMHDFYEHACSQNLDGGSWEDGAFENMIITYNGGPVSLKNVTFKNCLFLVSFPEAPPPPAQKIAQALLTSSGLLSSFTISVG